MAFDKKEADHQIRIYNSWLNDRTFPYKNSRILFNRIVKDGAVYITSIMIAEFKNDIPRDIKRELKQEDFPTEFPFYLYKVFSSDIGNCNDYWNETNIYEIFIDLIHNYDFETIELKQRFIDYELPKIEEFRKNTLSHKEKLNRSYVI
jgi:hypothetical protein